MIVHSIDHLELTPFHIAIWAISVSSILLVLTRPKGIAEAWWAGGGAIVLIATRLITPSAALHAVAKGADVYLFLVGMMIMSELARREGVFDWIAAHAVQASKGSRTRLFVLIYLVGTLVTIFLSNDATAVVLTPAVLAAVQTAEADALPYLLICAFIANAASFLLPISNPANLVVFGGGMPSLFKWLMSFGLPSLASILVTFLVLRWLARNHLKGSMKDSAEKRPLSPTGRMALAGIAFLAIVLMVASAFNVDLGAPAFASGVLVCAIIAFRDHRVIKDIGVHISWAVVPLVAGLFIIVEALNSAGALTAAVQGLHQLEKTGGVTSSLGSSFGVALISNLMNNLPSGLIAGAAVKTAHSSHLIQSAVLIGVDLGPNLSVSGSLATILWLIAIRREGQDVKFFTFLKWGIAVMPPALAAAVLLLR
jgi:arsenical pump membrane protein